VILVAHDELLLLCLREREKLACKASELLRLGRVDVGGNVEVEEAVFEAGGVEGGGSGQATFSVSVGIEPWSDIDDGQ